VSHGSEPIGRPKWTMGGIAMNEAKVRGVVHVIEPTKAFGQRGFRKRVVVLEQQNGRFPNYIPLEFTNDGCDAVDDLHVGEDVEIQYRLGGRKWQKDPQSEIKYFLSAEAIGFKRIGEAPGPTGSSIADANNAFAESSPEDGEAPF